MTQLVQLFRPNLGEREYAAVREVLRSGWLGLGPRTIQFEAEFADYVGASFAVATNSGTAALHLALLALGVGPGDEVLVPAITFVSTAHAARYCGATPVFVDIESDTLNIDPNDILRRMTKQTKAIIPVHYGGHACRMGEIWSLASQFSLFVVEDAAHACGARYRGSSKGQGGRIGGLRSDLTCFSFHAVKNLTTGEGGMVTCWDKARTKLMRLLAWCGIDKSTWRRTEAKAKQYSWYYEVKKLGYKYHMSDVQAALGLVQLSRLEETNAARRRIAERYLEAFGDLDWLWLPIEREHAVSSWHNFVIKVQPPLNRDDLNVHLKERNIATGVHYMPLHLQPYYAARGQPDLPAAERIWKQILTLPLHPGLEDSEVDRVIDGMRSFA